VFAAWSRSARLLNVVCRTVHLVAVSALLGGVLWGVDAERLGPSLWLAVGSGLGLVALESQARPSWLIEGRGLAAIGKLGLLAVTPFAGRHQALLLVGVVIVASLGAHLPRSFRHWSFLPVATGSPRDEDGCEPGLDGVPAAVAGLSIAGRDHD